MLKMEVGIEKYFEKRFVNVANAQVGMTLRTKKDGCSCNSVNWFREALYSLPLTECDVFILCLFQNAN